MMPSMPKIAVETTKGERPDLMRQPRIAIILDENTSTGGTRYEAAKGYFRGVSNAGGLPFGIPYLSEVVSVVLNEFDGLVAVGGRFAYPDSWYISAETSRAPPSERLDIERAIVEGYLERDKPVLGICAGMQMLACLNCCRLTPDLRASFPSAVEHDKRDYLAFSGRQSSSRRATCQPARNVAPLSAAKIARRSPRQRGQNCTPKHTRLLRGYTQRRQRPKRPFILVI